MGRPSKTGRGGSRVGSTGETYANRTDLNANRTAFKGQTYGTGVAQQQVQQAAAQGQAAAQNPVQNLLDNAGNLVPPGVKAPGEFDPLLAPTTRPGEPVTAGLPFGPGPNTIQAPFRPDPIVQAAAAVASVPAMHQTPMIRALAAAAAAAAGNASNPGIAAGQ